MSSWATSGVLLGSIFLSGSCGETPRACTAPKNYWHKPHNFVGLMPEMNEVALDHTGRLYWNGRPVSRDGLSDLLKGSHALNPEPLVFLQTEMGAPCSALDALRKQMDDLVECKKSHRCAEGVRSVWSELPSSPGSPIS